MIDKKKFLMFNRLTVLIIILAILTFVIPITYSVLKTDTTSDFKLDTAFYILKSDYYSKQIKLDDISPSETAFVYDFSVSNFEGDKRLETLMDYDLEIITTTNLPLTYELYMNEEYETGASNIIVNDSIEADNDGTYFRYLKTDTVRFGFEENTTNYYHLVVKFPKTYESFEYQDILEYVEVVINSKQVIE